MNDTGTSSSICAEAVPGRTLAQLIAEHRARNNIKPVSDRRRTPLIRRMQSRSIARPRKRR